MLETHHGGCHCGRVRFRIRADLGTIGECNCSICTKKGILHLPVPLDRFELLCGEGELTTYRFNTGTAQHTFCRHCGIHAFYVPRSDPTAHRLRPLPGFARRSGCRDRDGPDHDDAALRLPSGNKSRHIAEGRP